MQMPESKPQKPHSPNHGGYRPGAGRKKKDPDSTTDVYSILARAKAKHEMHRAQLAELDYRKRSGELLEKHDVEVAATRMHSAVAQFLRSLPDDLERKCALPPAAVEALEMAIDAATVELSERIADVLKG
jgi:phage terminase Nu1 subunit (DNA packaging protein)